MKFKNPLRYPGSKASFVDEFAQYVIANNLNDKEIVEPYAGSSSISLGLLQKGLVSSATLVERDPLIYSFWKSVFTRTDELIELIKNVEVTIEAWKEYDSLRSIDSVSDANLLQLGLAGLFFNRTNFSGVLHAGPIGGRTQESKYLLDCRFNKGEIISRIRDISSFADKVTMQFGDAVEYLEKNKLLENENQFFYIDPPYYKQGQALYRYHYNLAQHKKLADVLSNASYKWILSYDNHHVIEFLYTEFEIVKRNFRYSSRLPKNEQELLITNIENFKLGSDEKILEADTKITESQVTAFSEIKESFVI